MDKLKKIGTLLTCSALSFGVYASVAKAAPNLNEQTDRVQIEVASTEIAFTKNDLIKRFHALFPNQFSFLTANDFQMGNGYYYPNDETMRYELSFTKLVEGKRVYGNIGFVGENLEVEQFWYQPPNTSDALFPAKVSEDEALKIANTFIKTFGVGDNYQLEKNTFNYYPRQILTEPITYSFSFTRTENGVGISDQQMNVSVLGNGEIVGFYKNQAKQNSTTFDDVKAIADETKVLQKVKDNLSIDLKYQVFWDYQTNESSISLVYQPSYNVQGVNAISGKWLVANGYSEDYPVSKKVEKLSANPLPAKYNGVSVEEAKKIAEKLLSFPSDKVKLSIESIGEITKPDGQEVYSIHYMYQYKNNGHGTNLEMDKQTGEIIQYHDMKSQMLEQIDEKPKTETALTREQALAKALDYVKEWVPTYLHNYAYPIDESYFDENQGYYYFTFPRVVNGLSVMGDQISVGIAADGSLNSLNVSYQEVESWPSIDKIISEKEAKALFDKALSLKLTYSKKDRNEDNHHYDLLYVPHFNNDMYSSLDAITGKWKSTYQTEAKELITHPWAEEELNYLIQANILDSKGNKNFNGDAAVSREEALRIIINSLSYFYEGRYYGEAENKIQTFDNIDPAHPSYHAIERAVEMGILKPTSKSLAIDGPITREELAAWYVSALGLEQAAKHSTIYKLDIEDADKVQAEYTGYVALATKMGLFTMDQKQFHPDREVSYAELAVSIIRLAHEMAEKGRGLYY